MIPPVQSVGQVIQTREIAAQAALAIVTAAQQSLTEDLLRLPVGATFPATVIGSDGRGGTLLDTPLGQFSVRTGTPLQPNSQINLQLTNFGDTTAQFKLLSIDNRQITQAILPPAIGQETQAIATQTQQAVTATQNTHPGMSAADAAASVARGGAQPPASLQATVLSSAQTAQQNSPVSPEALAPGTQLSVRIVAVQAPPQLVAAATIPAQAAMAAQSHPPPQPVNLAPQGAGVLATQTAAAVTPPAAGGASGGPQDPTSGGLTQQGFRGAPPPPPQPLPQMVAQPLSSFGRDSLLAMPPGTFFQATPDEPAAPHLLSGTVAPNTANGLSLLHTPAGLLSVNLPGTLVPGSTVTLEVVAMRPPPPELAQQQAQAPPAATSPWPALQSALSKLGFDEPIANQKLMAALPQAGPRLAAAMSAFVAASRQGDIKSWLGDDTLRAIERSGGKEALSRLESEFSEVQGRERSRGAANGWSSTLIPMMNGNQLEAIHFHVRRPPPDVGEEEERVRGKGKGKGGTRFVLEVNMSNLGALQLDGLVQKPSKRLDFILRSEHPLPADMRQDLARLTTRILEASGLEGTISFRAGEPFVDVPRPEGSTVPRQTGWRA
jgi:hypothetical protein